VDDVINVSGHRIGTAEVESALVLNHKCAEAAVVGYEHPIKGQGIYAFVTLMDGIEFTNEIRKELIMCVRLCVHVLYACPPGAHHVRPPLCACAVCMSARSSSCASASTRASATAHTLYACAACVPSTHTPGACAPFLCNFPCISCVAALGVPHVLPAAAVDRGKREDSLHARGVFAWRRDRM
jgi:acyl-CoA synthetase (AMP-forming)/AMP-acid ligase II